MNYTINVTETAKNDLREIGLYIAKETQDKDVALKFLDELLARCGQLSAFPQSGAYPKDKVLKSLGYRYLVHGDYLDFYTVNEGGNRVDVVAFFNAKKNYMRVLRLLI